MLGAIQDGLRGIYTGFDRLDKAAGRIAADGAGGDLAGNMIDVTKARHEVAANVAVVRKASETIGSLIDVMA